MAQAPLGMWYGSHHPLTLKKVSSSKPKLDALERATVAVVEDGGNCGVWWWWRWSDHLHFYFWLSANLLLFLKFLSHVTTHIIFPGHKLGINPFTKPRNPLIFLASHQNRQMLPWQMNNTFIIVIVCSFLPGNAKSSQPEWTDWLLENICHRTYLGANATTITIVVETTPISLFCSASHLTNNKPHPEVAC